MKLIPDHITEAEPQAHGQLILSFAFMFLFLLFPFVSWEVLIALFFGLLIALRYLENRPHMLRGFEPMLKIRSPQYLVVSIFILLLVSFVLNFFSATYPLFVIGQTVSIATMGLGVATIVRCHMKSKYIHLTNNEYPSKKFQQDPNSLNLIPSSISMLVTGIIVASLAGAWIVYWQDSGISYNLVFFVAVIGSITAALFESIPSKIDENISIPLGAGMAMWLFVCFGYSIPAQQIIFALGFALLLGYLAYYAKIADISATLSATLIGVLIIAFSNIYWFVLLLTFFILGGAFTRYKYKLKESMGIAEGKGGVRTYENVFSNSTAALILAIAYGIYPQYGELIIFAYLGTVATAAGDTLASEIGTTSNQKPRMITTLRPVKTGVDGGVTLLGELSCIGGSAVIAVLAVAFGMVDNITAALVITIAGGFLGTNIDSLLGATLQSRGVLTNSGVNFVATFAGAVVSAGLYLLFF
ncbi:TIGR00297 family protein [Methanococcoides methylutens]|uniref:TIGR00297 family protein n=1 Tax=Methanococcoides methylutens MM1 TaxID=1434104 RepID=A0A0E3SSI2_METMT|nr:TIGR00297 family protein [Methanococcoides methylutens]AKB85367.1 hypothetical protein MCMEM_1314 [Methanococcoides methylutens MM1]